MEKPRSFPENPAPCAADKFWLPWPDAGDERCRPRHPAPTAAPGLRSPVPQPQSADFQYLPKRRARHRVREDHFKRPGMLAVHASKLTYAINNCKPLTPILNAHPPTTRIDASKTQRRRHPDIPPNPNRTGRPPRPAPRRQTPGQQVSAGRRFPVQHLAAHKDRAGRSVSTHC